MNISVNPADCICLASEYCLVTPIDETVINLANALGIQTITVSTQDEFLYIVETTPIVSIDSFMKHHEDVVASNEVFCEILMDYMSGMRLLDAYQKQGYTFIVKE